MPNFYLLCAILLTFSSWAAPLSADADTASDRTVLRSASELDYPPFSIVQPDGTAGGFSVDLLKAAVEAAGMSVTFRVGPWHELKDELRARKLDVLPLVSYSPERDKVFDFTAPYIRMNGTVFIRKGTAGIASLADLKDKEILVMKGDTAHEYAVREQLSDSIIPVESYEEAFRLLSAGRHDAVVVQQIVGLQTIKRLGIDNVVAASTRKISSLKPVTLKLKGFEQKFCFAVPEGERYLLSLLNEGLAVTYVDGTYNRLYEKWFSPILPKPQVPLRELARQVAMVLVPSLLLLSLLGIWYLKRLVAAKTATLRQEIEQRKLSETRLQETREELERFFQLVPDLVCIATTDGYFVKVNKAWQDTLGYTESELLSAPFEQLIHPDDIEETRREIARQQGGGCSLRFVNRYRTKNGDYRWLEWNATPMVAKTQLYAAARDITERKQAEHEREILENRLRQAQKMEAIGTLAGGIAHDFNNILGAIIGYAELVQDDCPPGTAREDIGQVLKAAHRAKDLVRQILAFSRQAELERIAMKPAVMIGESLKMLRSSLPATIEIQDDIDQQAGPIVADPTQIHQLVMNLCTNAYHAMEENGGILAVSLKTLAVDEATGTGDLQLAPGNYVRLAVEDTGTGIPPEIKDRIFDPYFTTKEVGKGTGLGLATVHGIVQQYGGRLTWRGRDGGGTVFEIYLPVESAVPVSLERAPKAIGYGTENILFVDDEEILVEMGGAMLSRLGYQVTMATSSSQALALFREQPHRFDLVITDETMPHMPGSVLARHMLQIRPELPIILCTGYSSRMSEEKARALGISGFALKPLAREEIASLIRRVMDGRKERTD